MADDDEFEKELTEMAHGGFPGGDGDGDNDDDDVFGENAALFDDLEDEDEDVPPPPPDDAGDEDDFQGSSDNSDDDFAGEFEDDDPEDEDVEDEEPLSEFMDSYDEEEDDEEPEEEEAPSSGLNKGKMVFWGAVSTLALAVGAVGAFVIVPMLTGGASQPPQQSNYERQSQVETGYTPERSREPVSIPGEEGEPREGNEPAGLPSMPGLEETSGGGMPSLGGGGNSERETARPGLGSGENMPGPLSLEDEMEAEDSGMPQLQLASPESDGNTDSESPNGSAPVADGLPETETEAGPDVSAVLSRLDDVINRLDQFEDDFMTEEETRDLVSELVEEQIAAADRRVASGTENASMSALTRAVEAMAQRVTEMEDTNATVASLETKIAELTEQVNSANEEEPDLSMPDLKLPDPEKAGESEETATAETGEPQEAPETSSSKETESEATRLRRELVSKQRELEAIKAKGRDVRPPMRPHMFTDYRLAGMSNDLAWIETPTGVSMFGVGQDIPGAGRIHEFRKMNGNFAVLTSQGVIIP